MPGLPDGSRSTTLVAYCTLTTGLSAMYWTHYLRASGIAPSANGATMLAWEIATVA
jgi:hypothetical protein